MDLNKPAVGICVVTYKRPKLLIKMLRWLQERTLYENYKVYIVIDHEEDQDTLKEIDESRISEVLPIEKVEMFSYPAECVKATNRCYSIGDEPLFVWLSDDMEVEKGWLQEAVKCMQTFPDDEGLVVFRDGIQDGSNACAGLISRSYIKSQLKGIFYNEIYKHFSADTELFKKSKSINRVKYCQASVVWHNHWGAKGSHKSEKDAIYVGSRHWLKHDKEIFHKRVREGFK